jgi:hypothetical protein
MVSACLLHIALGTSVACLSPCGNRSTHNHSALQVRTCTQDCPSRWEIRHSSPEVCSVITLELAHMLAQLVLCSLWHLNTGMDSQDGGWRTRFLQERSTRRRERVHPPAAGAERSTRGSGGAWGARSWDPAGAGVLKVRALPPLRT